MDDSDEEGDDDMEEVDEDEDVPPSTSPVPYPPSPCLQCQCPRLSDCFRFVLVCLFVDITNVNRVKNKMVRRALDAD